jgi:hypothetical protein
MKALLRKAGDQDLRIATAASYELGEALSEPLLDGILDGENLNGIFEVRDFEPGTPIEFPKSFLTPGTEGDYFAYVAPNTGKIPHRMVAGDYVAVPTFSVVNSIDTALKYIERARWDVVDHMMEVLQFGFTLKMNNDGWHTILSGGLGRNQVITDSNAAAGFFTKRLVAVLDTQMTRLGGGNVTSPNLYKVTDLYHSLEVIEDIRSWDLTQIDDLTRREIIVGGGEGGVVNRIFNKNLHPMMEFGVGQRYQDYWDNTLGGTMGGSDQEIGVALDLSKNNSLLMPMVNGVRVFPDPTEHRALKSSWYAFAEYGVAELDNRIGLIFSL